MTYFEKTLLISLRGSKIKMEIDGFDMDGFQGALREEGKRRLEIIESIVFMDGDLMTDAEKVSMLQEYFKEDFYP